MNSVPAAFVKLIGFATAWKTCSRRSAMAGNSRVLFSAPPFNHKIGHGPNLWRRGRRRPHGRGGNCQLRQPPPFPARRAATRGAAHPIPEAPMKRGFYTIMAAQFFSSLADNALLIA